MIDYWQIFRGTSSLILSHWIIVLAVVVLFVVGTVLDSLTPSRPAKYQYRLKLLVMTPSEFEFYKTLRVVAQNRYDVFPQIHLDAILDFKIQDQKWYGAGTHINQKSVDYVLCDANTGKITLAIELDDRSHEREKRVIRDEEVGRLFRDVQLPLLRVKSNHVYTSDELSKLVADALANEAMDAGRIN
jgi:hypothetical protein